MSLFERSESHWSLILWRSLAALLICWSNAHLISLKLESASYLSSSSYWTYLSYFSIRLAWSSMIIVRSLTFLFESQSLNSTISLNYVNRFSYYSINSAWLERDSFNLCYSLSASFSWFFYSFSNYSLLFNNCSSCLVLWLDRCLSSSSF